MSEDAGELGKMQGFIQDQLMFETKVKDGVKKEQEQTDYPNPETECRPPK